jgi:hypothetical protein
MRRATADPWSPAARCGISDAKPHVATDARHPLARDDGTKEVVTMTSVPHETAARPERRRRLSELLPREVWASLAISVMWVAVLLDSLFGPDMVFANTGMNTTTIPSAVVLALFAYLGTRVVARYGLGERE